MKKSLVALAVLAASGATFAQSTVTVYGVVDVSIASTKNENNASSAGAGSLTQTSVNAGEISSNRWGLKGSEDLGGGLKAAFNLEQGFNADDGSAHTAALAFRRQSWVGLTGNFGSVRLGRTTTPVDDVYGASDAVFDSNFSPIYFVAQSAGYTNRPNNTIFYQAPDMSGFSGAISYSLGENNTPTTSATNTVSVNLTYGAGPLAVQFGYQAEETNVVGSSDAKFTVLGASYTVGPTVLKATFGRAQNIGNATGADANDYQLGLDYSVSDALTLSASYAHSSDNAKAGDGTRKGYGFGAYYTLSKRTSVYAGLESDTLEGLAANYPTKTSNADSKHTLYAVGLRHQF